MALAIFVGGIAKGVSGVAMPITTLGIALLFVEARVGLALAIVPVLVTNVWMAVRAGNILQPMRRFWLFIVFFVVGLYVGAQLASTVDARVLFAVIGATTLVFTAMQFWRPRNAALGPRAERIVGALAGLVGGVSGGMTTVWGPPIMMFLFALKLSKDEWVKTVVALYLIGSVPLVLFYMENGILAGDRLWLSVTACIPAMLGIVLGERIRTKIDEEMFRKILLFALVAIGLNMIRRSVF